MPPRLVPSQFQRRQLRPAPRCPGRPAGRKLNGDEYIEVLLARQAEYMAQRQPRPGAKAFLMPTLDMFVRADDEELVDLPAPEPERAPVLRRYRTASYWR